MFRALSDGSRVIEGRAGANVGGGGRDEGGPGANEGGGGPLGTGAGGSASDERDRQDKRVSKILKSKTHCLRSDWNHVESVYSQNGQNRLV